MIILPHFSTIWLKIISSYLFVCEEIVNYNQPRHRDKSDVSVFIIKIIISKLDLILLMTNYNIKECHFLNNNNNNKRMPWSFGDGDYE